MTTKPDHVLGNLTPAEFLDTCWQQDPCLIRQAIPDYLCPVSPEELAGLACEPDTNSRIILSHEDTGTWEVLYGPFSEKQFRELPDTHWTLLVQYVDRYNRAINDLLQHFRFIPNWRIDDVMISYAVDQGTVGPHLDSYDVFLLQGLGTRHWQINRNDYSESDLIPGLDLRILPEFNATEEWTVHPGDMLYLPPGVAHHGVARGPCMTLSIGFLAPAYDEMVHDYLDRSMAAQLRYRDTHPVLQEHCGEISRDTLETIRQNMRALLDDDRELDHWFGTYITGLQDIEEEDTDTHNNLIVDKFTEQFSRTGKLLRKPGLRTAYTTGNDELMLYVNGLPWQLDTKQLGLVQIITGQTIIRFGELDNLPDRDKNLDILFRLYTRGFYYFE